MRQRLINKYSHFINASQARAGLTITEMMVALVLAGIILTAVYQTMRIQWRSLSVTTEEARMQGEAKRITAQLSQLLRNAGYNPLTVPYDSADPQRRIGILAAFGDMVSFSMDSIEEPHADGRIATATTLDNLMMPVANATDGREVQAIRWRDGNLEVFSRSNGADRWQVIGKAVQRFSLQYFDGNGIRLDTVGKGSRGRDKATDPDVLKNIRRIDLLIQFAEKSLGKTVNAEVTTTVVLRNPPFLTR